MRAKLLIDCSLLACFTLVEQTQSQKGGQNLSHISYNDETWHSYTLPKEDPKNI